MTVNMFVALGIAAIHAVDLAAQGQVILAVSLYFLVVELNAGVPLAIQIVVRALGFDLIQSDRDPLTGLLNRRSATREIVAAILDDQREGHVLTLAVIDLDRFKELNDTLGHNAGDSALVAVSHALRSALPKSTIIGRVGGDEFLLADIGPDEGPPRLGEAARRAVAHIPYDLTASVGTAAIPVGAVDVGNIVDVLTQLTTQADVAMYHAKKAGGNGVQHHGRHSARGHIRRESNR